MFRKPVVLFVCTGNAGRSQMAESLFRKAYGNRIEVKSAGVEPWKALHPMAVKLMAEEGLGMDGQYPKHVKLFADTALDVVVTIGDRAGAESCHFRTGVIRVHWNIKDPADADGTPDSERVFRHTRQAIADRFPELGRLLMALAEKPHTLPFAPGFATSGFRMEGFDSSASTGQSAAFRPGRHLPLLREAGFTAIELTCYCGPLGELDFPWRDPVQIKELRQIAKDCGVEIVSTHSPELHLCAQDKRNGEKLDILRRFIDFTLELEARLMVVHYWPEQSDDYSSSIPEALLELDRMIQDKPALVGLETLQKAWANSKIMDLFKLFPASSFGAVIDTGHCNVAGDIACAVSQTGRWLKGLHLHDNEGRSDRHLVPGKGNIDWSGFSRDLQSSGYEGPLTLEIDPRPSELELPDCLKAARQSLGLLCMRA